MEIDYLKLTSERIVSTTHKTHTKALLLLAFSFLLLAIVISIDAVYNPIDYSMLVRERDNAPFWKKLISKVILERKPVLDRLAMLRSVLILCSGLCIVGSITQFQRSAVNQLTNSATIHSASADPFANSLFNKLVMGIILLSSLFFLSLFIVDPVGFYNLGNEDQPVELLSVLFYFISFGLFIYIMVLLSKQLTQNKYYLLLSAAFAFGFFILGMEEISWFQRVFDIETPEAFQAKRNESA